MGKDFVLEEKYKKVYRNNQALSDKIRLTFVNNYRSVMRDILRDEEAYNKMFKIRGSLRLMNDVAEAAFGVNGSFDKLEKSLKDYENLTKDKCLRKYIDVYKDFFDDMSCFLFNDDGEFVEEWIDKYMDGGEDDPGFLETVNDVYKHVEKDYNIGFHWWKRADATALRRQLGHDQLCMGEKRLNALCNKYLNQDYDFNRMSDRNYNKALIAKLDKLMTKNGMCIVYAYPRTDESGNKVVCESYTEPRNVPYYIIEYKSRSSMKFVKPEDVINCETNLNK